MNPMFLRRVASSGRLRVLSILLRSCIARATWRRVVVCGFALGLACSLSGCGGLSFLSFKGDKVKWDDVTLSASDDLNDNSPIAVDIVLVYDDALLARVAELPASKWFESRVDLANSFPKGIRYSSWELVPAQRLDVPGNDFPSSRVVGAFVFANYARPGANRVRIQQFAGTLVVRLDANTFNVTGTR